MYDFIAKFILIILLNFAKTRERNVAYWSRVEFDNFTKQMRSTRVPCAYSVGLHALFAFGGHKIEILGSIELSVKLGNIVLPNEMFIVVKFHAQTIIGLHTTCKLKLVSCSRVCQITNHSSQKDTHTNHKSQVERTNGVKVTGRGKALSCTSQAADEETS